MKLGQMGLVKLYADPTITMCDIDRKRPPTMQHIYRVFRAIRVPIVYVRIDRSHNMRWHLIIKWQQRWTPMETIALQSMLGSDYKREMHNFYRIKSGVTSKRWNFLFESKLT